MPDLKYRWAEARDVPRLIEMAKNFHGSSPYRDEEFDSKRVEEITEEVLGPATQHHMLMLVTADDYPVGFLFGVSVPTIINFNKQSAEIAFWVDPEFRKSSASKELKAAYEYWAKYVAGCTIITLTALDDKLYPFLKKMYSKWGYIEAEHQFMKRV